MCWRRHWKIAVRTLWPLPSCTEPRHCTSQVITETTSQQASSSSTSSSSDALLPLAYMCRCGLRQNLHFDTRLVNAKCMFGDRCDRMPDPVCESEVLAVERRASGCRRCTAYCLWPLRSIVAEVDSVSQLFLLLDSCSTRLVTRVFHLTFFRLCYDGNFSPGVAHKESL